MIPGGEPRLQARVGAAMLGVIALAIVFVVAILPRLDFGGGVRVHVGFQHVGALHEGAELMLAGRQIGRVESIALVEGDTLPPGHVLYGTGGTMVTVRVDSEYVHQVPDNAEFFISSKGILSARYLEIAPPRDNAPPGPPVHDGMPPVRGVDPPSLDRTLQRTWDNMVRSRAFVDAVAPSWNLLVARLEALATTVDEVAPDPGAYGRLAGRIRDLAREAGDLRDTLDQAGASPDDLAALFARAQLTLARARAAIDRIQVAADALSAELDRLRDTANRHAPELERLRAALDDAKTLLARADDLVARGQDLMAMIARGEGSLAKLSNDPEFPEDAKELGKILKRQPWRVVGHPPNDH